MTHRLEFLKQGLVAGAANLFLVLPIITGDHT